MKINKPNFIKKKKDTDKQVTMVSFGKSLINNALPVLLQDHGPSCC